MKTLVLTLLAALLMSLSTAQKVMITDATGSSVTLPAPLERIVFFTLSCLHDLALLDVMPYVAPFTDYKSHIMHPDVFGEAGAAVHIMPSNSVETLDLEALAALAPDLFVVGAPDVLPAEYTAEVAPAVVFLTEYRIEDFDALAFSLLQLGQALAVVRVELV